MPTDETTDCAQFDEAAWLLLSGELDDDARSAWERHLADCDECASLLAARRRVLDVYDGLAPSAEGTFDLSRMPVAARREASWWRPAMAVAAGTLLLVLGALAGRMGAPGMAGGEALREIEQRLTELEVQLAVARIDPPTAAERLKATAAGVALVHRDPRILDSLLDALEADPSPNVRMAIIDALYLAGNTTRVEQRFERLFAAQASPMIRIALIELAADRRLRGTLGDLRRAATESTDGAVRERAAWAIRALTRGVGAMRTMTLVVALLLAESMAAGADGLRVSVHATTAAISVTGGAHDVSATLFDAAGTEIPGLVVEREGTRTAIVLVASVRPGARVEVRVPTATDLRVEGFNGGTVTVRGVSGTRSPELERRDRARACRWQRARIDVERIDRGDRAFDRPGAADVVSRDNGAVDVMFPADLKANLRWNRTLDRSRPSSRCPESAASRSSERSCEAGSSGPSCRGR